MWRKPKDDISNLRRPTKVPSSLKKPRMTLTVPPQGNSFVKMIENTSNNNSVVQSRPKKSMLEKKLDDFDLQSKATIRAKENVQKIHCLLPTLVLAGKKQSKQSSAQKQRVLRQAKRVISTRQKILQSNFGRKAENISKPNGQRLLGYFKANAGNYMLQECVDFDSETIVNSGGEITNIRLSSRVFKPVVAPFYCNQNPPPDHPKNRFCRTKITIDKKADDNYSTNTNKMAMTSENGQNSQNYPKSDQSSVNYPQEIIKIQAPNSNIKKALTDTVVVTRIAEQETNDDDDSYEMMHIFLPEKRNISNESPRMKLLKDSTFALHYGNYWLGNTRSKQIVNCIKQNNGTCHQGISSINLSQTGLDVKSLEEILLSIIESTIKTKVVVLKQLSLAHLKLGKKILRRQHDGSRSGRGGIEYLIGQLLVSELDLSSNEFDNSIMDALSVNSSKYLTTLNLSRNNLKCLDSTTLLVNAVNLKTFDISWNPLGQTGIAKLLQSASKNSSLTCLNVGYCCTTIHPFKNKDRLDGSLNALNFSLLTLISQNTTLHELNLSNNNLTHISAMVLFEALLENHSKCGLKLLGLDHNTLGWIGALWICRFRAECPVSCVKLSLEKCTFEAKTTELAPFAPGKYNIDFSCIYDRVVAKSLFRYGNSQLAVSKCSSNLNLFDHKQYLTLCFPTEGSCELELFTEYQWKKKKTFPEQALTSLCNHFKSEMDELQIPVLLKALCVEYILSYAQLKVIINLYPPGPITTTDRTKMCCEMILLLLDFPRSSNINSIREELGLVKVSKLELRIINQLLGPIDTLVNTENLTGHYELNLSIPPERNIVFQMSQLMTESPDTTSFRNVLWNGDKFDINISSFSEQLIPIDGKLVFDYVYDNAKRQKDQQIMNPRNFDKFLKHIRNSALDSEEEAKKKWNSMASNSIFSMEQLQSLMKLFPYEGLSTNLIPNEKRMNILISFFGRLRTIDRINMYKAWNLLDGKDRFSVMHRLGIQNLYSQEFPEGMYCLNLQHAEEYRVGQEMVLRSRQDKTIHGVILEKNICELDTTEMRQLIQTLLLKQDSPLKSEELPSTGYYHVICGMEKTPYFQKQNITNVII